MNESILSYLEKAKQAHRKLLAVLFDPDKLALKDIAGKAALINQKKIDLVLVGGSLLFTNHLDNFIRELKNHIKIPVLIFPGSAMQVSPYADGILFLSLLSGRNPDFLVGQQVIAAPIIQKTNLEVLATSYLLIESGSVTTASYISNTKPIPRHKPEIAMATALAGKMMGHQVVYLDGGSGAQKPVPDTLIKQVFENVNSPIIVGGGIQNSKQLQEAYDAGATVVVIGTAFENDELIFENLV